MIKSKYWPNRFLPFWLISLSTVFGLTLPVLIQEGMFQDGVLYTCVSRNLSIGYGTFWFPQYSTLNVFYLPSFHEHPPLVFGIQALFFKALGDSIYVERFYTFLMIVAAIVLMNLIWKEVFRDNEALKPLGWLPAFFWMIIPICFWTYHHNMQENTMSVFLLSSILLAFKALHTTRHRILLWLLSGCFVFSASMCKGIPGFFPVAMPFLYWLTTKKITLRQGILYSGIVASLPLVAYTVLFQIPESRDSLSIYFFKRVLNRIDALPSAQYQLQILWRLFTELLPPFFLTALVLAIGRIKRLPPAPDTRKLSLLFVLIGLSGSAPLALTMCQRGWYLVPSLPYFAIGLAVLAAPAVAAGIAKMDTGALPFKAITLFGILSFAAVCCYTLMQKGKISRGAEFIHDVKEIGKIVPRFSTVTVPPEMYNQYDFVLQGYLVRYFNISIDPSRQYGFYLTKKTTATPVPPEYQKVNTDAIQYDLYKKR